MAFVEVQDQNVWLSNVSEGCKMQIKAAAQEQHLPGTWGMQDEMRDELRHTVAVMGLPLANVTAEEAVDGIERLILSGGTHQVATANLDFWVNSLKDVHLHRIIAGCSLVLADGMPLVWISRLLGQPLKERVSGADLVPRLAELSARKGYRIFLLGGRAGVGERASEVLREMYPGVNIVGHYSPPIADLERMDHGDTLDRIHTAKPDILMVAFGNPKQEKWIQMHSRRLGVPVSIGIGGSMDMLVGDVRRSPEWMQRNGLEWLGRCVQEPTRLMPRYTRNFLGLTIRLPLAFFANLTQIRRQRPSVVSKVCEPGIIQMHVDGNLERDICSKLVTAVNECIQDGKLLIVDLKGLAYADADGLGALLDARQRMQANGLSVTLANVPFRMKLLLSALCVTPLFDELEMEPELLKQKKQSRQSASFATLIGKDASLPTKIEG